LFAFFENIIFQKRSADKASLVGEARLIAKVEIEEGKTALTTTAAPSKTSAKKQAHVNFVYSMAGLSRR